LSSIELFWLCAWLALSMVVLVWITRKPAAGKVVVAAD
jgi:DHA2 family multidrug resistance protein